MAGRNDAGDRADAPPPGPAAAGVPDIGEFLARDAAKDLLRFCTAGSVDDGKSTLIGRLLCDSKLVYEDHLAALARDSARRGSVADGIDYALLLDGLRAEREANITIDVAYRYFATARRKFIIADTPGHEQYTRNMVTGASTSDAAVVLVDARQGVVTQTRRHLFLMSLLGIRHVIVAVNKMDLVGYAEPAFAAIRAGILAFAQRLAIPDLAFVPVAALHGDNLAQPSGNLPWWPGPTLLGQLENIPLTGTRNLTDLRFPVQLVLRPHQDFRGYAGTVASGILRRGDEIMVLPSGQRSTVAGIRTADGELAEAFAGQAVVVTLADELDLGRGGMLVRPLNVPQVTSACEAMLVWLAETPLRIGAQYLVKQTTSTVPGEIAALRYAVDINTLHRRDAPTLALNDIGRVAMRFNRPLFTDPYERNRVTNAFIVIDRASNVTVKAGMV
ncbi:MAG TPA: sulfate adenylyltransferase subunit CysN, partial [bacterium]|nr:sulfate adenylyltransferase subunit CysN [bacterium]